MANDDDSIFDELDNRLDDFFADDDELVSEEPQEVESVAEAVQPEPPAPIPETTSSKPLTEIDIEFDKKNPLHHLKAIVLEMDWEISDENLGKYLTEIDRLIVNYKNDRPIYLFFKLHAAIGKYMLSKKASAHPEALKFLYGVYNSLEKAITDGVAIIDKNKLILGEVENFKQLKNKLFPDFYQAQESGELDEVEVNKDVSQSDQTDNNENEANDLDISALPDDVQKGINKYIEKIIAEKIAAIK